MRGAFRLRAPTGDAPGGTAATHAIAADLRGHWVILVDDVTTTGATLAACAQVLMDAGALAVSGLTVARER